MAITPRVGASGALLLSLVWPAVWRAQRNFRPWLSAGLYLVKTARVARVDSARVRNPGILAFQRSCRHLICEAFNVGCRQLKRKSSVATGEVALGLVCLLWQWQPVINFRARPSRRATAMRRQQRPEIIRRNVMYLFAAVAISSHFRTNYCYSDQLSFMHLYPTCKHAIMKGENECASILYFTHFAFCSSHTLTHTPNDQIKVVATTITVTRHTGAMTLCITHHEQFNARNNHNLCNMRPLVIRR